ncbi:glycosyltransferase family 4 protein [Bradyrhizobium guangdongense]
MKIAIFASAWPPGRSSNGIVTYVEQIAPALRELGHEVFVLTPSKTAPFTDRYSVDLASVEISSSLFDRLRKKISPKQFFHDVMIARIVAATQRLKDEHGLDLVEIEESFGWSFGLSRANIVPVVVRLHGPWFLNGAFEKDANFKRRVLAEGHGVRSATLVTAPSTDVLAKVRKQYGVSLEGARVIPNPITAPPDAQKWSLRNCDIHKLLYVGRFDERKGGDLVLNAFAELAHRDSELSLTFVGPDLGVYRNGQKLHFHKYVREVLPPHCWSRITYLGRLDHQEVMKLRPKHFLTVVASQFEILPYSILEAMSFGSPIVSSSVGGIPEVITDSENGLLFKSGDLQGLIAKCRQLLDAPERASQLGARARTFCQQKLESSQIAARTVSAYQAAIEISTDQSRPPLDAN